MAGETQAIQQVADKISDDIFKIFKWNRADRKDMNWNCNLPYHNKHTHPSDVVFYYTNPYENEIVYLNTDLKSYSNESISKNSVELALNSLALAVECANCSDEWKLKYVDDESKPYSVKGMLFLYNHDHLFDRNFYEKIFKKLNFNEINIAKNSKIYLLDPNKINDLINIANDIITLRGQMRFPLNDDDYSFCYPDLFLTRITNPVNSKTAATLELLMSPYIIIKYNSFDDENDGYIIYYNRSGSSVDEFVYFFDMLSNLQFLTERKTIRVRGCSSTRDPNAIHNFNKAKKKYENLVYGQENEKILSLITYENIKITVVDFDLEEIGMNIR